MLAKARAAWIGLGGGLGRRTLSLACMKARTCGCILSFALALSNSWSWVMPSSFIMPGRQAEVSSAYYGCRTHLSTISTHRAAKVPAQRQHQRSSSSRQGAAAAGSASAFQQHGQAAASTGHRGAAGRGDRTEVSDHVCLEPLLCGRAIVEEVVQPARPNTR